MNSTIQLALVDDHQLFRKGLMQLIKSLSHPFEILSEWHNGQQFLNSLEKGPLPDIAILDISMPLMDGFEIAAHLQSHYPTIKVLVLSMNEDEASLVKMLRLGVKGYLSKDVEPEELEAALLHIHQKGHYYSDQMTGKLIEILKTPEKKPSNHLLKEREMEFVRLACSELTYEQIADKMCLSVKTVDGYRASVFDKLQVRSRVGMVMHAMNAGWV